MGAWIVQRRVRFKRDELFSGAFSSAGDTPLGIAGGDGQRLILGPRRDWIGCFDLTRGSLAWAAGSRGRARGPCYIMADLKRPSWVAPLKDGGCLVCNAGRGVLATLDPKRGYHVLADLKPLGLSSPSNCVIDSLGMIWVNDVHRAALWILSPAGKLLRVLGNPEAFSPQPEEAVEAAPVSRLEEARLSAIWDVRCGGDGLVYILEGRELRLRAIDFQRGTIALVAGCGRHGWTGDGGDPRRAAFGRSGTGAWDGPLAFCLDGRGRIFIADTRNGVIRMVDEQRRTITTIAGKGPAPEVKTDGSRARARFRWPPWLRGPLPPRRDGGDTGMGPDGADAMDAVLPSVFWLSWSGDGLSITDHNGEVTVIKESPDTSG